MVEQFYSYWFQWQISVSGGPIQSIPIGYRWFTNVCMYQIFPLDEIIFHFARFPLFFLGEYITEPPIIIHCLESWWRLWLGNLDVLSWFTNGMAGRAEMDRGRCLRAKCKSLRKPTWNHHEPGQNSVENVFQRFYCGFKVLTQQKNIQGLETVILDIKY